MKNRNMLTNQISPTDQQFAHLQSYPKNTPLVMLNVLRFKSTTSTNETGQEVYARYFKNAQPFVVESGAKLIWKGEVHTVLIGDSENAPHLAFLVEYPSVDHFFGMVMNPEYQKIASDRGLALEYGGLIACQTAV
ncbi:MAG: DUF1330 domain-containing protein [Flavobacterium sp.]|nr:MAG: DUF1330 domain-containing protein [Flavobacterium sp.]